ncbi:MAG TPA: hypothetical protein P5337_05155 [Aestuariivirga sp.]|nr:hypothetical protein [Aestuariivirga sp.]
MTHYIIEFALWTLLAFFIGCLIGWLLRSIFGSAEAEAPHPGTLAESEPDPVQPVEPAVPKLVEMDSAQAANLSMGIADTAMRMDRPKGLEQARDGKPDDLQRISGIGPKNEKILHTLGFFHFDQIAEWTVEQVAWVDDHLKFNGRIGREEWIAQARLLADGKEEEFRRLYGSGGKVDEDGKTGSGEATRRS